MTLLDFSKIVSMVNDIASKNGKIELLTNVFKKYKVPENEHSTFAKLVGCTYSPRMVFGVTGETIKKQLLLSDESMDVRELVNLLLSDTKMSSSAINKYLFVQTEEEKQILVDIFNRQLKWGMNTKSINHAYKPITGGSIIYQPRYMRCSTWNEKTVKNIVYPAIAQLKADSEYVNIFVRLDEFGSITVSFESRSGKPIYMDELSNTIKNNILPHISHPGMVFNGELMVRSPIIGETYSRTENRSRVSSYLSKSTTSIKLKNQIETAKSDKSKQKRQNDLDTKLKEWQETEDGLYVICWDVIPFDDYVQGECTIPYKERLSSLERYVGSNGTWPPLRVVEYKEVHYEEEINEYQSTVLARGEEGLVVKNYNAIWKDGTSTEQLKVKDIAHFEMKVIGIKEGDGKYVGGIGSLILESEDKKIVCNCSGLSDTQRGFERVDVNNSAKGIQLMDDFETEFVVGSIVSIYATELSKAKNSDTYSLSYPRLDCIRLDKDEADDFVYISNQFSRK